MEWRIGRAWSSCVPPIKHYNVRMNMHKRTLFRHVQYWLYLPQPPRSSCLGVIRRRRSRTRRNNRGGGAIRTPHKSPRPCSLQPTAAHTHTPLASGFSSSSAYNIYCLQLQYIIYACKWVSVCVCVCVCVYVLSTVHIIVQYKRSSLIL